MKKKTIALLFTTVFVPQMSCWAMENQLEDQWVKYKKESEARKRAAEKAYLDGMSDEMFMHVYGGPIRCAPIEDTPFWMAQYEHKQIPKYRVWQVLIEKCLYPAHKELIEDHYACQYGKHARGHEVDCIKAEEFYTKMHEGKY